MTFEEILNSGEYHLIDVRQPEELQMDGAIEGAVNIPLATVPLRLDEIKEMKGPKSFSVEVEEEADKFCQFLAQKRLREHL